MPRYLEGSARDQVTLLPECLDDYITEDNPVRVVDAFVEKLNLKNLGFEGMAPASTGRPSFHPALLLKIYIYGYLNRDQSSRRLERECQRNLELMWLTGRLAPDFKTIADFRRDSGAAIRAACGRFVVLCRELKLFLQAVVAIDSGKSKAVNSRDRNFTPGKIERRKQQIEQSVQRYLDALETADRTRPEEFQAKASLHPQDPRGVGASVSHRGVESNACIRRTFAGGLRLSSSGLSANGWACRLVGPCAVVTTFEA